MRESLLSAKWSVWSLETGRRGGAPRGRRPGRRELWTHTLWCSPSGPDTASSPPTPATSSPSPDISGPRRRRFTAGSRPGTDGPPPRPRRRVEHFATQRAEDRHVVDSRVGEAQQLHERPPARGIGTRCGHAVTGLSDEHGGRRVTLRREKPARPSTTATRAEPLSGAAPAVEGRLQLDDLPLDPSAVDDVDDAHRQHDDVAVAVQLQRS